MKTHSKILSILMVVGLIVLNSCNSRNNNTDGTAQDTDTTMMEGDNTTVGAMSDAEGTDAEALALIMAVDMHEIDAATEAQKKELSQPVMDYAKMLHTEHSKNLQKGQDLSQSAGLAPAETEKVQNMKEKGANDLAAITPLNGKEFERAYIDAMVKGHTDALNMLDNELIPAAQEEALKNHLSESRMHVAMHLDRAKELQANMQ